jgi:hypothetical protein
MPIMTHLISDARLAARWRAHLGKPPVPDQLRRLVHDDASTSAAVEGSAGKTLRVTVTAAARIPRSAAAAPAASAE